MSSIEETLWEYIDGQGTAGEREQIAQLIKQNPEYQQQYEDLLLFNNELNITELDEPPMAFTYNVMEQIRTQEALVPLQAGINKRIIQGLAGFFILTILAVLVFVLLNINWNANYTVDNTINQWDISGYQNFFSSVWLKGFLFFDVVLGLFVLDNYLRRGMKKSLQIHHN